MCVYREYTKAMNENKIIEVDDTQKIEIVNAYIELAKAILK
jgi:hypothetical protein